MVYRGDYDPAGFDQATPATWPAPAPYSPGDWWNVTGPGTVGGVAVDLGDRVYPIGTGRLYGEDNYGDGVYGGAPPAPPWPADPQRVRWVGAMWTTAPAWDRFPGPYAGEPFGDTGWRISVEAYLTVPEARLYGSGSYGSGLYGDTIDPPQEWRDVTCPVSGAVIARGVADGRPYVDVDQAAIDLVDLAAEWFPMLPADATEDGIVRAATVGTPIRVALISPDGEPFPIFTGRLDDSEADLERPPRLVEVNAYGMGADLGTVATVDRPAETVAERLEALRQLAGYGWGWDPPAGGSQTLRRTDRLIDEVIRQMIDRTALSASLTWRTDTRGVVGFVPWPVAAHGEPLEVTDRLGTSLLAASRIITRQDTLETLNLALVGSDPVQGSAALTASATDGLSLGRFGRRDTALGFPITDLFAQQGDLDQLAAAAVARYGRIVNRIAEVEVNNLTDERWLEVLAGLQLGRAVEVTQTKPRPVVWSAVLVGYETRIIARPARIAATLYLSTLNPTI